MINPGELAPKEVFSAFSELSAIPRCSKNEGAILAYLKDVARKHGHTFTEDATGNLLVMLAPSPGLEALEGMTIQGHVDMVCEKEKDSCHDFSKDGLELYVDGEWLRAKGTTLGADNGIAIAMMISIMRHSIPHGPLDLLFTVDEETGLTGALNLDASLLRYKLLMNIDNEEEEALFIGCAGGVETEASIPFEWIDSSGDEIFIELTLEGLRGGHSGSDIHRGRGNALVLLSRILWAEAEKMNFSIHSLAAGDKHNVIPREATVVLVCPKNLEAGVVEFCTGWQARFALEYGPIEPGLRLSAKKLNQKAGQKLSPASLTRFLAFMRTLPHGVLAMSRTMEDLVKTSSNFASLQLKPGNKAYLLTSQRSDHYDTLHDAVDRVRAAIIQAGGTAVQRNEYPAWTPDPESPLLALADKIYKKVFGRAPLIKSIHAGLETGVIGARKPGIRMISFGPDIRDAHSPAERLHIASTGRMWTYVKEILISLGN